MEKKNRLYYLTILKNLLELCKEDNLSLTNHMKEIEEINPYIYDMFNRKYSQTEINGYTRYDLTKKKDYTFADGMITSLPKRYNVHANLEITPLNRYNSDIEYSNSNYIASYNYLLFLLMFTEEFANTYFSSDVKDIAKYKNTIIGSSKDIIVTMDKDSSIDLTTSEIIIPNEARIKYDASSYKLKKLVKKEL